MLKRWLDTAPVYSEVGLDATYYQQYGPKAPEPLHSCFSEPTMAGVVTGYDLSTRNVKKDYWEMFFRRHYNKETNYNKVKLFVNWGGKLSCGITSVTYKIDLEPASDSDQPDYSNSLNWDVHNVARLQLEASTAANNADDLIDLLNVKYGNSKDAVRVLYIFANVIGDNWSGNGVNFMDSGYSALEMVLIVGADSEETCEAKRAHLKEGIENPIVFC